MNLLKNFLTHVQKSVFEGHLPPMVYKQMVEAINKTIDKEDDSVRIYEVPKDAFNKIKVLGLPPITEDQSFYHIEEEEG